MVWLAAACGLALVLALVLAMAGAGLAAYAWTHRHVATSQHAQLVYAKWVPDPGVTNGPEPGYKPALTGLTGADIAQATASIDPTGESWVVDVTFTPSGAALFAEITHDAVAACPGDPNTNPAARCPQRSIAMWLGLTQGDIGRWHDAAYVGKVSAPYDLGCLSAPTSKAVCAKLISNPLIISEVDGGQAEIYGALSRQAANALAAAISAGR